MKKSISKIALLGAILCCVSASLLALEGLNVPFKESTFLNNLESLFKKFESEKLAKERIYIQTDKSLYSPGETIWFSTYLLNVKDLKPSLESDIVFIQLLNPKGGIEKEIKIICKEGKASGDFELLADQVGGIYKLKSYTLNTLSAVKEYQFEKEITIQAVQLPRIKMVMDFERRAYGAGDEVKAKIKFNTLDNKPMANKPVNFALNIDGRNISQGNAMTDVNGLANITTKLPSDLNSSDGLLGVFINNEGQMESISRSVPIVLNKIGMEFFPEGGDLVVNLKSRIAFKALNEFGKGADITGVVVDDMGKEIAEFSSFHFGMGSFEFIPLVGRRYFAMITKPMGIKEKYVLPNALVSGFTMKTEIIDDGKKLSVKINSSFNETLSIMGTVRNSICFKAEFDAKIGDNKLEIPLENFPMGVAQITVFDDANIPRTERLIFVNKDNGLKISIKTNKEKYLPREKVEMNITTTDKNGKPVPANLSLSVVDDKILSYQEDRSGTILAKLFLEPELSAKVEEAKFYFDDKEPKADSALDFLLMTSGWRRYTWANVKDGSSLPTISSGMKATIYGYVRDANTLLALKGRQVHLIDNKGVVIQKTITNSSGIYLFKVLEPAKSMKVKVMDTAYQEQYLNVLDFNQYTMLNLVSKKYLRNNVAAQYNNNIPQMARGGVDIVEFKKPIFENDQMAMAANIERLEVKQMPPQKDAKNKKEAKNQIIRGGRANGVVYFVDGVKVLNNDKNINVANDDANMILDKPAPNQGIQRRGKWAGNINNRMDMDEKMQQPEFQEYYRAKEFPKVEYKKRRNPQEDRTDFRSTVYWNGSVVTSKNGTASLSFYLSDEITSFRAVVEGMCNSGQQGLIGHSEGLIYTQLPFSISAKIPKGAMVGDKIFIPIFISNNTSDVLTGLLDVSLPKAWQNCKIYSPQINVEANGSKLIQMEYVVNNIPGKDTFSFSFQSGEDRDGVSQEVVTGEKGFPQSLSFSGKEMDKTYSFDIKNPLEGSISASVTVFPNSLNETMKGLESILAEPYGCFEQTSSSNYPNIIALQYMNEVGTVNEVIRSKASDLLDRGYKKLISFETKEKGYEWFGGLPAHEALTAYGLMEFNDMKSVYKNLDNKMVDRTAQWLISRKDGNGGFKRDPKALDNFGGASTDVTNAYIVYAMLEGGYKEVTKELDAVYNVAISSKDPYLMGLVLNALYKNNKDDKRAKNIVKLLLESQAKDGSWEGKQSITRTGGIGLKVETTALIAMGLINVRDLYPSEKELESSIQFIISCRQGTGGFGATQTTIMALKALINFAKISKQTSSSGTIVIYLDNKVVAEKNYLAGEKEEITFKGLEKYMASGTHTLRIKFKNTKEELPHTVCVNWKSLLPEGNEDCKLSLSTSLMDSVSNVSKTVRMNIILSNKTSEGLPMSMAIVGIPAGMSLQPWQLKELQEKKVFDFYEIAGNELVLYYRQMAPNENKEIKIDLKSDFAGNYESAPSRAYLYYTPENKFWAAAKKIKIGS